MNIFELKNKVAQAKAQQMSNTANPNIRDFAEEEIIITGMHITENITIAGIGSALSKVTYSILKGKELVDPEYGREYAALDSFHEAAVSHAKDIIEVLGEYFPAPMICRIVEVPIKNGTKNTYYVELVDIYDDPANPLSLQEAAAASANFDSAIPSEPVSDVAPAEPGVQG
jgi:hypothetical protein